MAKVDIKKKIKSENDRVAELNQGFFRQNGLYVLNLLSSPGSGKTSLLERTVKELGSSLKIGVIVGDVATQADADRIKAAGARAHQIETRGACHLDARMVAAALEEFTVDDLDILFIENIGNLVCPAGYWLGEEEVGVLLSVAEGDDKPSKYPLAFANASLAVINKVDLCQMCRFDMDKARKDILAANPEAEILELSCTSGEGFNAWLDWLRKRRGA